MPELTTETVLIDRDFCSRAECDQIAEHFDAHRSKWTRYAHLQAPAIQVGAADLVEKVRGAMRDHFGEPDLVEDGPLVVEMRGGDYPIPLHADAEKLDGTPNHTHWRSHVGLLYLTTAGIDHEGGELRLPEQGLTFSPAAGLLVGFPADREHVHEVLSVTTGRRLALSVWTKRPE